MMRFLFAMACAHVVVVYVGGAVVSKVCVGGDFACVIRASDSRVVCSGDLLVPESLGAVVSIACGETIVCAVTAKWSRGVCWTGPGAPVVLTTPQLAFEQLCVGQDGVVCGLLTNASALCFHVHGGSISIGAVDWRPPTHTGALRSISCGSHHVCGIARDGRVVCWGSALYGARTPPLALQQPGSDAAGLSCGDSHCCVVTTHGSMQCFGYDYLLAFTAAARRWGSVACGERFCCGCRTNGTVECFGRGAARPPAGTRCDAGLSAGGVMTVLGLSSSPAACALRRGQQGASARLTCWGSALEGSLPPSSGEVALTCDGGSAGWGPPDCEACAPGHFALAGFLRCEPCAAGYFASSFSSSTCSPCAEGSASKGRASECTRCSPGEFADARSASCDKCSTGFVSDGSVPCAPCSAGSTPDAASAVCVRCPAGSFARAGALSCEACPAGSFNSRAGAYACTACPVGMTSGSGGVECMPVATYYFQVIAFVLTLAVLGAGAVYMSNRQTQRPGAVVVVDAVPAPQQQPPPAPQLLRQRSEGCNVCFENPREIVFVPCRHQSVCRGCSERVQVCPLCNQHITERILTFRT